MAFSAFVAAKGESFAQKQPTLSSNFGLVAPQPADELPQAQTPPSQPVRKAKRTGDSRLAVRDGASWNLAEGWELTEADNLVTATESLFNPSFDTSAWYDAVVPGTVLTSLVETGV